MYHHFSNKFNPAAQCVASQLNTFNDYSKNWTRSIILKIDSIEDLEYQVLFMRFKNGEMEILQQQDSCGSLVGILKLVAVVDQDMYNIH